MSKNPPANRRASWAARKPSILRPFPSLRMEELEAREVPATFTWNGASPNSNNWSDPANWVGNVAPSGMVVANDDLVFPAGPTKLVTNNDLGFTDINGNFTPAAYDSITFSTTAVNGGYTLGGNPLILGNSSPGSGFIVVNTGSTGNKITLDVTLGAAANSNQFFTVNSTADLTISGDLSSTAGSNLVKKGSATPTPVPGILTLSGDNSAFTGAIVLENNAGTLVATTPTALGTTTAAGNTTVGTNSTLALSNVNGSIDEVLRLNGPGTSNNGALVATAGTATWTGPITLDSDSTIGASAGAVLIVGGTRGNGTPGGVVADSGAGHALTKEGTGEVRLNAANTYRGLTTVNSGILTVGNALALGTSAGGTLVNSFVDRQGQLRLADPVGTGFTVLDEVLTLNGAGQAGLLNRGSLTNTNADNTWAGSVLIGSPFPNGVSVTMGTGGGTLTISGVISSPNSTSPAVLPNNPRYDLTKVDTGTLIFNNANIYNGTTTVAEGTLDIRDSKALGTNGVLVQDGGTLRLDVEAGIPGAKLTDAHNRNLDDDSVTHDALQLRVSNAITLVGLGADNGGALRSATGINIWDGAFGLGGVFNGVLYNPNQASVGVDLDTRTGHPTPDSSYFVNDFSLTANTTITGSPTTDFIKTQLGQLILPNHNTYLGETEVLQGWVTIQDNHALGDPIPSRGPTVQPRTNVSAGAAVHVKPLTLASAPLSIDENITLGGTGPSLPYAFISRKGALMNLGGDNVWTGDIALLGTAGIGVEQINPLAPTVSRLATTGLIQDGQATGSLSADGGPQEFSFPIDTGTTSGTLTFTYDAFSIPDRFSVYYPSRSTGAGVKLYDSGYVSGSQTISVPYSGTETFIELVVNEGVNPNPGTAWTLSYTLPAPGGSLIKFGSQQLTVEGHGTYTGSTEVREGTISARNNTALGLSTSGTAASQEAYNTTTTEVRAGAVLTIDQSIDRLNGGIASGIQETNERLILDGPAQQVAVAGTLVPAPANYTLTFTQPGTGFAATTAPIIPGASAAEVQAALNVLSTIRGSEIQKVNATGVVGATAKFTLTYGGQTTIALPLGASAAQVQAALLGLSSIQRAEVQTVAVRGAAGTFTLSFNGQTTAPLAFNATAAQVQTALNALTTIGGVGGSVAVIAATVAGTTTYTITFASSLGITNVPQITAAVGAVPGVTIVNSGATTTQGFGGTVTVTAANIAGGQAYTIAYGGELALQNLPQITAAGQGGVAVTPSTVRDGVNGKVTVTDALDVPTGGTKYTITFGDVIPGDPNGLANKDLPPLTVTPNGGTSTPTVTTAQDGNAGQSEVQDLHMPAAQASFTLKYRGVESTPLPITAPASQVQDALNALSSIQADFGADGGVKVSRTGNVYTVIFGVAHSRDDVPLLVATPQPGPGNSPPPAEVTISGVTMVNGTPSLASVVSLSQDNAWRGPVTLNAGSRVAVQADSRLNLLGAIDDAANAAAAGSDLVKRGTGDLLLGGNNSFRGTTWIDQGILTAANSGAFGAVVGGTVVANNAQLQIRGSITVAGEPLTVQGTGVPTASGLADQWFNVGPAPTNNGLSPNRQPTTTRITSVAVDSTDANVIYISTAGGGAWKTKDRGVTWVPLFDDAVDAAAVRYGGSIAVSLSNPSVVYFATGESNPGSGSDNLQNVNGSPIIGQGDNYAGTGVYKSTDAGATWTLVTGPNSYNPIAGQAVTKILVDPEEPNRIYLATGVTNILNVSPTAVAGVYRYDGSTTGSKTWVNLTATASPNRTSVAGSIPPPGTPGPDDDYRIAFPQDHATWSDIYLVKSGYRADFLPGYYANFANNQGNVFSNGSSYVLYAALGESEQRYFTAPGVNTSAILNAVYRTEDPGSDNPTWWLGTGTVFPVAPNTGGSTNTGGPNIPNTPVPAPTKPDREQGGYPVGPVIPPSSPHAPGRNEWIKLSGVVYDFQQPAEGGYYSNYYQLNVINAHIQVYATNLGNKVDNWSYTGSPQNPTGDTGQLLDVQMTGWDGGLWDDWRATAVNPNTVSPLFGLSEPPAPVRTTYALGRYDNAITLFDKTPGIAPTDPANQSNDPRRVYLGGKTGIFETTSSGGAWTDITTANGASPPAIYFHALTFSQAGELLSGSDGGLWSWKGGVFADRNGNLSATQLNAADPHPFDLNQMLAASYNNGLQQFNNSPAWSLTGANTGRDASFIRYDPQNPQTAYAVVDGLLWKTVDGGQNWVVLWNAGQIPTPPRGGNNIFPLVVDDINPSRILFGGSPTFDPNTGSTFVANALYESSLGGAFGSFINLGAPVAPTAIALATYQGQFVLDPSFLLVTDKLSNTYDPDTIYVTNGTKISVTKNHGVSWTGVNARTPVITDNRFSITFGGSLGYVNVPQLTSGTAGGAYTTLSTYPDGNGLVTEQQYLEVTSYAGNGTFTLTLNGSTTVPLPANATAAQIQAALNNLASVGGATPANAQQDVTVTGTAGTFTLTFNGQTTTAMPFNETAANVQTALEALANIGVGNVQVTRTATAGGFVYHVTFVGTLGATTQPPMTGTGTGSPAPTVSVAVVNGGGTGSVTVTALTPNLARGEFPLGPTFTNLTVDAGNRDKVYVTVKYANGQNGPTVLRSVNAGQTWTDVTGDLPTVQTWTATVDARTDTLYIGNDDGVWALPNASRTPSFDWTRVGAGLPDVQVHDLQLNQTLNTLTVGTYGRGAFQLLLTDYQASSGAIHVTSGTSVWTGPVTLTGPTLITASGTQLLQNGIGASSLNIIGSITDQSAGSPNALTKSGLGTIILSGSNTYGGQTLVQQGVLTVNNARALGASTPAANTVVAAGAALELQSDLQAEPVTVYGDGIAFNGHFTGALRSTANNNVYTGPLTLGTKSTIGVDSGSVLTIGADPTGGITGTGSVTDAGNNFALDKELAGTLVLATDNTYTGVTTVNQGAIRVESANALGTVPAGPAPNPALYGTFVRDGAQIQIARNAKSLAPTVVASEPLYLSGTGINVTGALENVRGDTNPDPSLSNDNTWAGPITLTGLPAFSPPSNPGSRVAFGTADSGLPGVVDTLNINTDIQQDSTFASIGLIKVGPGRVTLTQANSYTGTTEVGVNIGGNVFAGGSLRIQNAQSLGRAPSSDPVQTVTVVGTTGTYTLSYGGQSTVTLPAGASAATVQAALNNLSNLGQSERQLLTVAGSGQFTLTFDGQTTTPLTVGDSPATVQAALRALSSVRRSEVQQVQVTGTSGQFTLSYSPVAGTTFTTVPLAYNEPAANVKTAIVNAFGFNAGDVNVTSAATGTTTTYTISFVNGLANQNINQITAAPYVVDTPTPGTASNNETQTVSVTSPANTTFILTFNGLTTAPIPANASAQQVQDALNALPSISGVGGSVTVVKTANPAAIGGNTYAITFGGTLGNTDVSQIIANGAGGPATNAVTLTDGLNGTVTVTQPVAGGPYVVDFGGALANQDVPQITGSGANATVTGTTTREGSGVLVSETPTINGKVLTVTFKVPLAFAYLPQLGAAASIGLGVTVATTQAGGTGAVVAAGSSLELDGAAAGGLTVNKLLTINGTGVQGTPVVTANAGNSVYTINFQGYFGNVNLPQLTAAGASGTTATVATTTDGGTAGPEVQTVTVSGSANGTFTLSLNGETTAPIPFGSPPSVIQNALLVLNGFGAANAALNNVSGNNTYAAAVTLGTDASIGAMPGTTLTVPTLQDPTGLTVPAPVLTKTGQGTLVFPNANAYGGQTTVLDGILNVRDPQAVGSARSEVQTFQALGTSGALAVTFNGQTTAPLALTGLTFAQVETELNKLSSVKRTEVQQVQVGGNSGTFHLAFAGGTFGGNTIPAGTTPDRAYNVNPSLLQADLEAIFGINNVLVTSAPAPGSNTGTIYTITFTSGLLNVDLPLLTAAAAGGATAVMSPVQDGLNGTATVTAVSVPNGQLFTVTFGGQLANTNLPQIVPTAALVFTNTTRDGNPTTPASEQQTVQTFLTSGTYTLTFPGVTATTGSLTTTPLAPNAPATGAGSVQEALLALSSVRHNETQDITVLGTSGTFRVSFTTGAGTFTTGNLQFNVAPSGGVGPTASLQNALEALSNIGAGNVTVTSNTISGGTVYHVTFQGTLGYKDVPQLVGINNGNGATPTVTTTLDGLGGTVGVTRAPAATGPGFIYTLDFGGDLANRDLPQITATATPTPGFASAATITDGNGAETQYVQVTATNGTFTLSFNGASTPALLYTASAADVENALNALPTISSRGGSVTVTKAGTPNGPGGAVYMVNFGGFLGSGLSDVDVPPLAATTTGGTSVSITTGNDGPQGTTVANGATLQLQGTMTVNRELVTINGQGFVDALGTRIGAINAIGDVTWQGIPVILGSNASVGTTGAGDKLTFQVPLSDGGSKYDLDVYGPGTVTYAGTGTTTFAGTAYTGYTGTTTVHEGTLRLDVTGARAILGPLVVGDGIGPANSATVIEIQDNEIADTVPVTVKADGHFDLNGKADTFGTLTVTGGTVDTRTAGQLTSTNLTMDGGTVFVGDNATLNTGAVSMVNQAKIIGGNTSTVNAGTVTADNSSISFQAAGKLTTADVTLTNGSTVGFGADGVFTAGKVSVTDASVGFTTNGQFTTTGDLALAHATVAFTGSPGLLSTQKVDLTSTAKGGSQITFADNGTLTTNGKNLTVTGIGGASPIPSGLTFGNTGKLDANAVTVTDGTVAFGTDARVTTTGDLTLVRSTGTFGTGGVVNTQKVFMTGGALTFTDTGTLNAGDVTDTGGAIAFNNKGVFTAGTVSVTNGSVKFLGTDGQFTTTGDLTTSAGVISFGGDGTLATQKANLTNGSVTFADTGKFTAADTTLDGTPAQFGNDGIMQVGNLGLTNASSILFGLDGSLTAGNVTMGTAAKPSTITLGAGGDVTVLDVTQVGGSVSVGDGGTIQAQTVNVTGGSIAVGNTNGKLTLGNTTVTRGSVSLGTNGDGSVGSLGLTAADFAIGSGSTIVLNGNVTADSAVTTTPSRILGPGTLDVGAASRTLTVNNGDGVDNVDLLFTAQVASTPTAQLVKAGVGRLEFAAVPGFSGPVTLQAGDTQVDASTTIGPVTLTGGTLSGNGTVGTVSGAAGGGAAGVVSPGNNYVNGAVIGTLHAAGTVTFGSQTTFVVNLDNSADVHPDPDPTLAGGVYDRLTVDGDIFLNGASLAGNGVYGSNIQVNDRFTIIHTTNGTVQGKFAPAPGNTADVAFIDGHKFTVSYTATDVVLTKVLSTATVAVASSVSPSTRGQAVTFTATVTAEQGAVIPAGSTVTFTVDGSSIGNGTLTFAGTNAQGQAVYTATSPPDTFAGDTTNTSHTVVARLNAIPNEFAQTDSPSITQVVEVPTIDPLTVTTTPPQPALAGTTTYISPLNADGIEDVANLFTTVRNERETGGSTYTVTVTQGATTVRTFTKTAPVSSNATVAITDAWDGRNDSGNVVADGSYQVVLSFSDNFGNTVITPAATVVVDDTAPTTGSLVSQNLIIAPGTGPSPGTTAFTSSAAAADANYYRYSIVIKDAGGAVVRQYDGVPGDTSVDDFAWDGKTAGGAVVPDGTYTATLVATDLAGNSTSPAAQAVVVLTHPPALTLTSNSPIIYGQTANVTATVGYPLLTLPTAVTDRFVGNPVEIYNGANLVGSGNLVQAGATGQYTFAVTHLDAGTYTLTVRYPQTADFLATQATTSVTVLPATLTVTPTNQTKVYGDPLPPLTLAAGAFTVSGLQYSDTAAGVTSGSLGTTATQSSPVGTYAITQGSLQANANYTIAFTPGATLTVTKAPLTVVVDDATRPVHAPNPPFTFTAQGLRLGDPASVVTGLSLATTATPGSPVGAYPIFAAGTPTAANYEITNVVPGTLSVTPVPTNIVVGAGAGGTVVNVYNPQGQFVRSIVPFGNFTGGVRTVAADFNGDGVEDIAVGTGPGANAQVAVFDGRTGTPLFTAFPFDTFQGGLFVAAGDIDNDGAAELVITPDQGGGPRVVVYHGNDFAPLVSYFGINDPNFRGGARAGVGDINGDGFADIAVSAGFNGGPRVSLWDGKSLAALQFVNLTGDFFAFADVLRNGAYVAVGDVNGDGFGDLIAGAGPGGGPQVKVFDGRNLIRFGPAATQPFANFFAGNPDNRGGVRVTAKNLDNDLFADVVAGVGEGGGSGFSAYRGKSLATGGSDAIFSLDAFPGFNNGVFVG